MKPIFGLMRLLDEIHLIRPYFGARRICEKLCDMGEKMGRKHVRTLMNKMCITAIYSKPRLSKPNHDHRVYPYLLRGVPITRANHVWAADITYIPMARGFCYLVAIMDWASRKILSWRYQTLRTLDFAWRLWKKPSPNSESQRFFNTDQGSQFYIWVIHWALSSRGVQISMDGKGSWKDNVFIERFWKSVQVRRSLPERLRIFISRSKWAKIISWVLQPRTEASGPWL